jgi:hypothetical protein
MFTTTMVEWSEAEVRVCQTDRSAENPFFTGIFADGRRCERREEAREWVGSFLPSKV